MPKLSRVRYSLDTETTGLDLYHGARPFFVTMCREGDPEPFYWRWDVDPLTRTVRPPKEDLEEIRELLVNPRHELILQNAKYDIAALLLVGCLLESDLPELYRRVRCTLFAGHLLASNQPHDLTTMALVYIGANIKPFEEELDEAIREARRMVVRPEFIEKHGVWRIAKEGLPEMPSAKGKDQKKRARGEDRDSLSKFDMWLPWAVAEAEGYPEDHRWRSVCSDYSNADSAATLPVYVQQLEQIKERGLESIYQERLKLLAITHKMERGGVSISGKRLGDLRSEFGGESQRLGRICTNIAASYNYDLTLPKSGNNNSLLNFAKEYLIPPKLEVKKTPSGEICLDKGALETLEAVLPHTSKAGLFVKSLRAKRRFDTAETYLASYEKFWLPVDVDPVTGAGWYRLHPSLNPNGTDTLRWSSSNPNSQNISKQTDVNLRRAFGPMPGREWWSCDASNIELRIPAYEANEPEMVQLFDHEDEPPYYGSYHMLIFDTLHPEKFAKYGMESKKVYASTWYQWTKNGDFAVQYGAVESSGTADRAYHIPGAQRRIKSRFKEITKLSDRMIEFADRYGYVETIPDKSVCPERGYPLLCTRSQWGKVLPTVPLSYHVQGTAMWWMMKAMIRCDEFLSQINQSDTLLRSYIGDAVDRLESREYRIVLQVHDELVFEMPKGIGDEPWKTNLPIVNELRALMRNGGDDIGVPTPVGCEYHADNWAEGKSV